MKHGQFRQGDVLIEAVSLDHVAKPQGTGTNVPAENGRVVVAHGEVTGHAHALTATGVKMFDTLAGRFLQVDGPKTPSVPRPVLAHEEHGAISLEPGVYAVTYQREYTPASIKRVLD